MKLGLDALFFIFFIVGFLFMGALHENAHVEIARSYGINSHVEYFSHFPDFVTIMDEPCPNTQCVQDHNNNEVVGYNLQALYLIIGIGMLFMIAILGDKRSDKLRIRKEELKDEN